MDARLLFEQFDSVPWSDCYIQHDIEPFEYPIFWGDMKLNSVRLSKYTNNPPSYQGDYVIWIQHRKSRRRKNSLNVVVDLLFNAFLFKDGYQHLVSGNVVRQRGFGFNSNQPIPAIPNEISSVLNAMILNPGQYQIVKGTI